jgi:GH18 family chitinase
MRLLPLSLLFLSLICSIQLYAKEADRAPIQAQNPEPVVAGYFPFWSVYSYNFHIQDIRDERLTHIIYQYANLKPSGKVVVGDQFVDTNNTYEGDGSANREVRGSFGQLALLKEKNPDLNVIISIGGWAWSGNFSPVAQTAKKRKRFVDSTADFVELYGFDGVEIDWRFPVFGGNPKNKFHPDDQKNQAILIKELRQRFDQLTEKTGNDYQIMLVSSAVPQISGAPDFNAVQPYLDYIMLASATMTGSWTAFTAHQSPLSAPSDAPDHHLSLEVFLPKLFDLGLQADKTILKISAAGVGWAGVEIDSEIDGQSESESHQSINALYKPWKTLPFGSRDDHNGAPSGIFTYQQILELEGLAGTQSIWDDVGEGQYLYNRERQLMLSFESPRSIAAKLDFAQELGLAGAALSDLAGDTIDQRSQLHSVHGFYYPWSARSMLIRDWLAAHITLVSSLLSALLACLFLLFIWLSWARAQAKEDKILASLETNKYEMIQQLALSKTMAELISLFFERYGQQIQAPLTLQSQQKLLEYQQDHHFIYALSHQVGDPNLHIQLRPRDIQLNAILLVLQDQKSPSLEKNTWLHADPRAILAIWRALLSLNHIEYVYLDMYLTIKVTAKNSELLALSQVLDRWQQPWSRGPSTQPSDSRGDYDAQASLVIKFERAQAQQSTISLQFIEEATPPTQRLNLLQSIQQKTLLNLDVESQLNEVLAHLENDELVQSVNVLDADSGATASSLESLSPSLQLRSANNEVIQLTLVREASEQDREFFECINQLLQLSRSYVAQIAQQPQLLAELYDISSRLDKLNFIKAEKGYSGIYEAGKKSPRYIVMRLKAIKLYFEDQHLVQVHRSWLVNPKKVQLVRRKTKLSYVVVVNISKGATKIQEQEIPLGRSYLESLKHHYPHWFDHARAK